jgi:hypothetical protein
MALNKPPIPVTAPYELRGKDFLDTRYVKPGVLDMRKGYYDQVEVDYRDVKKIAPGEAVDFADVESYEVGRFERIVNKSHEDFVDDIVHPAAQPEEAAGKLKKMASVGDLSKTNGVVTLLEVSRRTLSEKDTIKFFKREAFLRTADRIGYHGELDGTTDPKFRTVDNPGYRAEIEYFPGTPTPVGYTETWISPDSKTYSTSDSGEIWAPAVQRSCDIQGKPKIYSIVMLRTSR